MSLNEQTLNVDAEERSMVACLQRGPCVPVFFHKVIIVLPAFLYTVKFPISSPYI